MAQEYLGRGIKFPLQVNPATGRLQMSARAESVKESIYIILMTQKTERFARSGFGSRLMSYPFMDMSTTWITMMSQEIWEDIVSQEPRVTAVTVDIDAESQDGCLLVNVDYTIVGSNTRGNLVFPFYLKGTDGSVT